MAGETVQFDKADDGAGDSKREQSTIAFPYLDLDAAVEVAKAVYNRSGLGSCELHELAAQMNQTISGAFRVKTSAARTFDLLDKEGKGTIKLSELGRQIVSPDNERAARAEAFMRVPLYAKIYDKYKGHLLPPFKALEREMQGLGVSPKVADKARQAFERSARQAGYFEAGEDRLVRPRADLPTRKIEGVSGDDTPLSAFEPKDADSRQGGGSGGSNGSGDGYHPFVQGLLDELPKTDEFAQWGIEDQAEWLSAAAGIFKLLSKSKGKIKIEFELGGQKISATDH